MVHNIITDALQTNNDIIIELSRSPIISGLPTEMDQLNSYTHLRYNLLSTGKGAHKGGHTGRALPLRLGALG